ncbi:hypothetical protein ACW5R3_12120 [Bizionia sp. KMM 8389]
MKETLNEVYDDMTKRLYMPMVFYIPRRIWNQFEGENWSDEMYNELFDRVVLIKSDGASSLLSKERASQYLIIKKERLDKLTFKLLELQKNLEDKQFKFILSKYVSQLDFCRKVSIWMLQNVKVDVEYLNTDMFLAFQLQQTAFQEHWIYVQENFSKSCESDDIRKTDFLGDSDLKSLQDLMNSTGVLSDTIKDKQNSKVVPVATKELKQSKKEKKELVTEEEATAFLLRTVFNMDS